MHKSVISRSIPLLAATASLSILAAACGVAESDRDYAAPRQLCGTPVHPKLLAPFLPGGKQLEVVRADSGVIGQRRCNVLVDHKRVLSMESQWRSPGTEIADVSASGWQIDVSEHIAADRTYSFSEEGGVSKVLCPNPAKEWRSTKGQLFVSMYTLDPDPKNEAGMEALLTSYARATGRMPDCNSPGAGS
ncbi:hypothetical protein ACIQM4_25045 [Streptomyces sp. NPDC091272]|uniref:hypothetical protein n=1 Tax=Streptomyces sp. NPDC091272 TaxID=3365981 RepID=UPI00380BEEE8